MKFTSQGHVRLAVTTSPGAPADGATVVRFEVIDTGIGIEPSRVHRLFKSFSQVDSSTTRQYGGTGLGLAICKRLVELMGGTIGVNSKPGVGSTFWFELPLPPARMALPHVTPSAAPTDAAADRRLRVLLVEDNSVNQLVAGGFLRNAGHDYVVASDGQQALAAVRGQVFDVVLMDCQMPVMDGLTATRHIRAMERDGDLPGRGAANPLPIIALTANATLEDREACHAAGMTGYISKPLDPAKLLRLLGDIPAAGAPAGGADEKTNRSKQSLIHSDGEARPAPAADKESETAMTNATTTNRADRPPIDSAALLDRCMGDFDFLKILAAEYNKQAGSDVAKIAAALASRDAETLRRTAHTLKGASSYIAAESVRETAHEIETAAAACDFDAAAALMDKLAQSVDLAMSYLNKVISGEVELALPTAA